VEEILRLFERPDQSGVINLTGLPVSERKTFFASLLPQLTELRTRTGRPHWLIIDSETIPAEGATAQSLLQIAARPGVLSAPALDEVTLLLAAGDAPEQRIQEFCEITKTQAPRIDSVSLQTGEVLAWRPRNRSAAPFRLSIKPRSR